MVRRGTAILVMVAAMAGPAAVVTAGPVAAQAAPPSCTTSSGTAAFVCQVYVDLLGRTPEPAGLTMWTTALESRQLDRQQFAVMALTGVEYRRRAVDALYRVYLGRPADEPGREGFVAMLGQGTPIEWVRALVLGSAEYYARRGGTVASWVDGLYTDVLGRAPDAGGAAGWAAAATSGQWTREDIAMAFLWGREGLTRQVTTWYRQFLRRDPDPAGLTHFVDALCGCEPEEHVMASIIASDEYVANAPF